MNTEEPMTYEQGYSDAIEDVVAALQSYAFPFGQATIDSFLIVIKELNNDKSS